MFGVRITSRSVRKGAQARPGRAAGEPTTATSALPLLSHCTAWALSSLPYLEEHLGILPAQQRKDLGQQILGWHGGGGHAQGPRYLCCGGAGLLLGPAAQGQDLGCISLQHRARRGQAQGLGGTNHQTHPQLLLQGADMGAHGGLGQIEGLGGLGEAAQGGHLDKNFQLFELHRGSSRLPFSQKWGTLWIIKMQGGEEMPYEKLRLTAMTAAGG